MTYPLKQARELVTGIFKRTRDYSRVPYLDHLEAVSDALEVFGEDLQVVGMLHSLLEHSDWDEGTLLIEGVPDASIDTLKVVTHDRQKFPLSAYFRRVRNHEDATLVKIACTAHNSRPDRLDTIRPFLRNSRMTQLGFAKRHLWTAAYEADLFDILQTVNPDLLTLANLLKEAHRL